MKFLRKYSLILSGLICSSICSLNAMDRDITQSEETHASIIASQDLAYCTSVYTDLITKNKTLAELHDSLKIAKDNLETTKERLEKFLDNKKLKELYNQQLQEYSDAKSKYLDLYESLVIKFTALCSNEGLSHLCSQFVSEDTMSNENVSASVSAEIDSLFKKAWTLVDSYKKDSPTSKNRDEAKKLFLLLTSLHPYAAQGLVHCSASKIELESALLDSIRMKLACGIETGLLRDLELLSKYQNMRDVNLLLQAAQYYKKQFEGSKNPMMIYNALCIGTMMPLCQESTLFLSQIAPLNILSTDNSSTSPYWIRERQSYDNKLICYEFMNFCRNQENIQSLKVFLQNNNFEGEWFSTKEEQFLAQQLEMAKNEKAFWSHKANLKVLQNISNSQKYSEETRLLAAKVRLNSMVKKSFEAYFEYYKILKLFNHVDRCKYIGVLHGVAEGNIYTHPEQLYKLATELGLVLETLPMLIKSADAGCNEALTAIESHDIFLTTDDLWEITCFFARHNSITGLRNLHKKYNKEIYHVIARELGQTSQILGTVEEAQGYLPLLDLEYEKHKAEIKKLEKHIAKLQEMIQLINKAQPSWCYEGHVDVTYFYRPTEVQAAKAKKNIEADLYTSQAELERMQHWIKMYAYKRQDLIESMSPETLFSLAKEYLLIYQALNIRLRDGQEKTKILKDTYFEFLKTAAENVQEANKELNEIETNGFYWPFYVIPSEQNLLEGRIEFYELREHINKLSVHLNTQRPLLYFIQEQREYY